MKLDTLHIWKIYMIVGGVLTMIVVMLYTNFLANNLRNGERQSLQLVRMAFQDYANKFNEEDADYTMSSSVIEHNQTIPLLLVDERSGKILESANFPANHTEEDFNRELEKIRASGTRPILFDYNEGQMVGLYYKESTLLTYITYFPYIILLLLFVFMGMGYVGVSASRQAEQNQVWVGMAKETAHQLGTPISAIVAWIEHLRLSPNLDADQMDILEELENDVGRLELIADRFSKIGSHPKMSKCNIYIELEKIRVYMQRRASRKVVFDFPTPEKELMVDINAPLFNWVLENLLRNALDAMDGAGTIAAKVHQADEKVIMDISDTGKGVAPSKTKTVFKPGYTTKKRGWGLGLSLAKRIIEEYHSGRIYVKQSEPGKGTTFTIELPMKMGAGTLVEPVLEAKAQG